DPDEPDLLGRPALHRHPDPHGGARHALPADGAALQIGPRGARRAAARAAVAEPRAGARPARPADGPRPAEVRLIRPKEKGPGDAGALLLSAIPPHPRVRLRIMKLS